MWLHGHASLNLVKKHSAYERLVKPLTVALTRGHAQNVNFRNSFRWQIYVINSVDKTKLYDNLFSLLRQARVNRVITCTVNSSLSSFLPPSTGSVVVHRSVEFEGLRFGSSWGLRILFIVPRSCQDEKHISLRSQSALENLSFTPSKCVYIYEPWWKRIAIQQCVLFRCDLTSTRFVVSLPFPSFRAM